MGKLDILMLIRYKTIMKGRSPVSDRPFMIDPLYWADIDTEADWTYAEWLVNGNTLLTHQPQTETAI
ncbi:hypothetical protein H6F95_01865 [Cyanobacteria bacterium FACHB-471]|nr:hypothetical protein [Cyanobacteria bacterium FACHB-471]